MDVKVYWIMLYSIHSWNQVWTLVSTSPASCKTPVTSIVSICPNIHPRRNKNPEKRSNSQQIVSYCLGLHTQNPRLREVDLGTSPKRDKDKINKLRPSRKSTTANKLYHTAWTQKWEPSTYGSRTDRTKALVSLYWSSWSLPLKYSFNRVLKKSALVKPIKSSRTWKETNSKLTLLSPGFFRPV